MKGAEYQKSFSHWIEQVVEQYKKYIDLQGDYMERWNNPYIHSLTVTCINLYVAFLKILPSRKQFV